jgi:hypothetical protein
MSDAVEQFENSCSPILTVGNLCHSAVTVRRHRKRRLQKFGPGRGSNSGERMFNGG